MGCVETGRKPSLDRLHLTHTHVGFSAENFGLGGIAPFWGMGPKHPATLRDKCLIDAIGIGSCANGLAVDRGTAVMKRDQFYGHIGNGLAVPGRAPHMASIIAHSNLRMRRQAQSIGISAYGHIGGWGLGLNDGDPNTEFRCWCIATQIERPSFSEAGHISRLN